MASGLSNNSQNTQSVQQDENLTVSTFFASIIVSVVIFGVEVLAFLVIKNKLPRIYQPRTFLVPKGERTKEPPTGLWKWALPVFRTSNSEFIQKCGLDAYFFLRYLRLLLKLFIPMALVILPILLPLNSVGGRGSSFASEAPYNKNPSWANVTGLNTLAWSNIRPTDNSRYWGHLVLALMVIAYSCWLFYDELRGYIRLRQAYLTSPQHRLRASATTVLVSGIPKKWCTAEALEGLYDVFPGGIRNIWINRDYEILNDKVNERNQIASMLEAAQTNLIRAAKKNQMEQAGKDAKKAGQKRSKSQQEAEKKKQDEAGAAMAESQGISSGDPHQTRHNMREILDDAQSSRASTPDKERKNPMVPIPVVGEGLEAMGRGMASLGRTVFGGIKKVGSEVNGQLETTQGFVISPDEEEIPARRNRSNDPNVGPAYHFDEESPQSMHPTDGAGSQTELYDYPKSKSLEQQQHQPKSQSLTEEKAAPRSGVAGPRQNDSEKRFDREPEQKSGKSMFNILGAMRKNSYYDVPSPQPKGYGDEFPLHGGDGHVKDANLRASEVATGKGKREETSMMDTLKFWQSGEPEPEDYPQAYDENYDSVNGDEPLWKKYVKPSDRETVRLPIFGIKALWFLKFIPFSGKKVDTIDYCRKELARLNAEIETDQKHPEKYPLMNSAFIQFNHQVAAHMACQSVSHHIPNQMAPRTVEIAPDDVIWDNMSVKWWERYLRTGVVLVVIAGLVIGWSIPVAFTGLIANISYLAANYSWLAWLSKIPTVLVAPIQGVLPQALLSLLLILLPYIMRFLAKQQGVATGMQVELATQNFYFFFLFVQVFLIVTLSSGIANIFSQLSTAPQDIPSLLASNLPKGSNYFFSYLLLQALSTSAGTLLQISGLIGWFVLGPLLDSTARQKWARQVKLPNVQWGTFFPVYTNLAVIGLVYSIIAPLILIFNIITFGLFWFAYRYTTLYVTKFRFDTGGLLFPTAVNQLFVGLYVMEICLIGLFGLVKDVDADGSPSGEPCVAQLIIMVVALILTGLYQWLLNNAFGPLFRYLPITLEDEAVIRDEQFARSQQKKFGLAEEEQEGDDINEVLEERERRSEEENGLEDDVHSGNGAAEGQHERHWFDPRNLASKNQGSTAHSRLIRSSWADKSRRRSQWLDQPKSGVHDAASPVVDGGADEVARRHRLGLDRLHMPTQDAETQRGNHALGDALFSGINDEIEDLTPDERDRLVQRAFQHQALRARRPVIWVPRDDMGVSDDEIRRTRRLSKHIWISNEYTGLDSKAKVVYRKSPPDFSEIDLIEL